MGGDVPESEDIIVKTEIYTGSYCDMGMDGIRLYSLTDDAMYYVASCTQVINPSYVCAYHGLIYSVSECTPKGSLCTLKTEGDEIILLNAQSTFGADPCHIEIDNEGGMLYVSNYTSGSLAVYQLNSDGIPVFQQLLQHEGRGVNLKRQEGPHVHYARKWKDKIAVVDLGIDKIFFYDRDKNGLSESSLSFSLKAGLGPRHLTYNPDRPDIIYISCELGNAVAVYRYEKDRFRLVQEINTIPDDFLDYSIAAAIRLYGTHLYVSNRGHNSIAVFDIMDDGRLKYHQHIPCRGKTPRDFQVLDTMILCANQDSDAISMIPLKNGVLDETRARREYILSKPTCIAFKK